MFYCAFPPINNVANKNQFLQTKKIDWWLPICQTLENGNLVVIPTETVYGLAADCENLNGIDKIFETKGRPKNHPLIVHIASINALPIFSSLINNEIVELCEKFWPGPLTLVLPKTEKIPDEITGGQTTVALRCPSHPVALALLNQYKNGLGGLAAPSANKFGRISPTRSEHIFAGFGINHPHIHFVLEGGACQIGIESTILDMSNLDAPTILRSGVISAEQIESVIQRKVHRQRQPTSPRVSGDLAQHYAPLTYCVLLTSTQLKERITLISQSPTQNIPNKQSNSAKYPQKIGVLIWSNSMKNVMESLVADQIEFVIIALEQTRYARDIYAALHQMDNCQLDEIWIENIGGAVRDRLTRACAS